MTDFNQIYLGDGDISFDNFVNIVSYALDSNCPIKHHNNF